MCQHILRVPGQRYEIRVVPATLAHPWRKSTKEAQPVDLFRCGQKRRDQPMISIEHSDRFCFIQADKDYRTDVRIVLENASADRIDLGLERGPDVVMFPHAIRYRRDREVSSREPSPLCSRKY